MVFEQIDEITEQRAGREEAASVPLRRRPQAAEVAVVRGDQGRARGLREEARTDPEIHRELADRLGVGTGPAGLELADRARRLLCCFGDLHLRLAAQLACQREPLGPEHLGGDVQIAEPERGVIFTELAQAPSSRCLRLIVGSSMTSSGSIVMVIGAGPVARTSPTVQREWVKPHSAILSFSSRLGTQR